MRSVGVVTTSRADYGIYRPVLRALEASEDFELRLFVSGTHLLEAHGSTVDAIEADGFEIQARLEVMHDDDDSPSAVARTMGRATQAFADAFERWQPDFLMVLGDRYEMHAAAAAALPFGIPVVHLHGGELSEGAIDDALRHSMTKLSHLHCVSTEEYGRRVIQLGEQPWRVHITGAPSLDNLAQVELLDRRAFETEHGIALPERFLLVTFHPVTLEVGDNARQTDELLAALERTGLPVLMTMPNADTEGRQVFERLQAWATLDAERFLVKSLGLQGYFSAMDLASAMVGNSSSGLIEAPSFDLPVVNVGSRQDGRTRGANVVDTLCEADAIVLAIERALDDVFRHRLTGAPNPYGDGHATGRILDALRQAPDRSQLVRKSFFNISPADEHRVPRSAMGTYRHD
jgi:UDP-hydrolysing UDP-N-acetyl-D-glucosamine 2-epimerase